MKNKLNNILIAFPLRKINSIITVLIFLLLFTHISLSSLLLLEVIAFTPFIRVVDVLLAVFVLFHVIISLYLYYNDKKIRSNIRTYFNIRNDTQIQIISGILIIVFASLHIIAYAMYFMIESYGLRFIFFVIDLLLFSSLYVHLRISIPRLMVSFGFLDGDGSYLRFERKSNIVLSVILIMLICMEIFTNLL